MSARVCPVTGKAPLSGNKRSHSLRATRRTWNVNLQKVKVNLDGKVVTLTNNNGGINGGISNGMPVTFNVVVKPTPSIAKTQQTINMKTLKEEKINVSGRHDPCIVRRVNIVVRCMTALVIADLMIERYGKEIFYI